MSTTQQLLDDESFQAFPLHDAKFGSLTTIPAAGGFDIHLKVELHEQESFGAPVKFHPVTLVFESVRASQYKVFEVYKYPEVIADWEIVQKSPVVEELKQKNCFGVNSLVHYRFILSCGSQLDIAAQKVFLIEN